MMSMGFSRTVVFGLIMEICDFCSSVGFGVWFTAESVISASGAMLLRRDGACDCGEADVSGVGSEDFSGWVMGPLLWRGYSILFLFKVAAAACEGDWGSSPILATESPSSFESLAWDVCTGSPDIDRRDFRAGRVVLGVAGSAVGALDALDALDTGLEAVEALEEALEAEETEEAVEAVDCRRDCLVMDCLGMDCLLVEVLLGTGVYSSSSSSSSSSSAPPWLEGIGVTLPESSESGVDSTT